MKLSFWLLLLTSLAGGARPRDARAQAAPPPAAAQPLVIGETFSLPSKVLGETRTVNVYLPEGYTKSAAARLPVLYMPDGGLSEDFLHIAGLVQVSIANETMRSFILVGIANTERRRDLTGPTTVAEDRKIAPRVGGSAAFRQFIRTELMPAVRARYRTTDETAIVGESLAGLFVLETLLLEPDLFTSYLAVDPSLWWNGGALVEQAPKLLQARAGQLANRAVYLTTSSQGTTVPAARLAEALKAAGLRTHNEPMPNETHSTIFHPAALRGVRWLFKPTSSK